MPQIYLPMHSVTDWPVLVTFVKLTPTQISETNSIYHTENWEREFTNDFNLVPPTHILQAPLTTKKCNPITANVQPGIGKGCNNLQPQSGFDCISKSQVWGKTDPPSYEGNPHFFFSHFLWFTCLTFMPLPHIQGRVYYFFLKDKRLNFLCCLFQKLGV